MENRKHDKDFFRTILVVDDEAVNREILGMILEQDYEVIYATNGREALAQIYAHQKELSLVLLDILMPEVDGFTVLEAMQADEMIRGIPVIVLTSEKSSEVKSLQLGAADFLTKPYDLPEVILARVRHSIDLYESENLIKATELDELTGLYTRDFFFEYGHEFDKHRTETVMDAIVLNFNRFHIINELHGRAYGDNVLRAIASEVFQLAESVGGIACRYDADTFYIYVVHSINYKKLLDRIQTNLTELLTETEIQIRMGVFQDVYREVPLEQRFDRALQACNSLRGKYGSKVAVYDKEMHDREVFVARLLSDFDTALKEKQFKVFYQPKYNIKGKFPVLSSLEALVSWQHPEFGRISPTDFIPLFEKNGLVQKLDHYVWKVAAEQIRDWKDKLGVTIPVSVNVSRVDIYDAKLFDYLLKLMKDNGIEPSAYLLEITESAYTDNSDQIVSVVNRLREAGFRVEMDDFGSGYSSLNMLTSLPIDALKLDMAFVRNIAGGSKEMRMVELVLDIARYLGVPVVAEGVETKEQYELLKKAGCDIIQGFYFSRAIPPELVAKLLKQGVRA